MKKIHLLKKLRYFSEWLFTAFLYHFLRLFSVGIASFIFGKIARTLGFMTKQNKIALRNLEQTMPELSKAEIKKILKDMWENLGRVAGEFPHLDKISSQELLEKVKLQDIKYINDAIETKKGVIIFSAHIANWEIIPRVAYEVKTPFALIYRRANNPFVNKLMLKARSRSHSGIFDKGKDAARNIIRVLKNGGAVGMLVDQKMNDGRKLKFFGKDAMTATAMAEFALKYGCELVPISVERKKGFSFIVRAYPPMKLKKTGDFERDVKNITQQTNDIIEGWIRKNPAQWFWVHNRWGKLK